MDITIKTPETDLLKIGSTKTALEKLAKNVSLENLKFLAELSEKPNINAKLEAKKGMIKTFL